MAGRSKVRGGFRPKFIRAEALRAVAGGITFEDAL
jgi:hypothetical protein